MSTYHPLSDPSPVAATAGERDVGPLVSLRVWLAGSPWRLSGGWLALAGMVAAAGPALGQGPWLLLLLALALAEVLWGALWWQLVPARRWPLHRAQHRPNLPYIQPASPAGRLLGWPEPGVAAAIARAGAPLAALALLLALAISPLALLLTGAVCVLVLLAMIARRAGQYAVVGWLYALVVAALPFALGVAIGTRSQWPPTSMEAWLLGLTLGYSLLAWALAPRSALPAARAPARLLMAAAGFVALLITLLASRLMLAAGVVGLLAAAPLLILAQAQGRQPAAAQPWTLAAILVSAAALGFGIG